MSSNNIKSHPWDCYLHLASLANGEPGPYLLYSQLREKAESGFRKGNRKSDQTFRKFILRAQATCQVLASIKCSLPCSLQNKSILTRIPPIEALGDEEACYAVLGRILTHIDLSLHHLLKHGLDQHCAPLFTMATLEEWHRNSLQKLRARSPPSVRTYLFFTAYTRLLRDECCQSRSPYEVLVKQTVGKCVTCKVLQGTGTVCRRDRPTSRTPEEGDAIEKRIRCDTATRYQGSPSGTSHGSEFPVTVCHRALYKLPDRRPHLGPPLHPDLLSPDPSISYPRLRLKVGSVFTGGAMALLGLTWVCHGVLQFHIPCRAPERHLQGAFVWTFL
jgi:hypothetical protein